MRVKRAGRPGHFVLLYVWVTPSRACVRAAQIFRPTVLLPLLPESRSRKRRKRGRVALVALVGLGGCKTPPSLRYLLDYDLLTYLPTPPPSHVFEFHSPTHLRVGKYFFLHLPFPPVFWEFVKFQITLAPPPPPQTPFQICFFWLIPFFHKKNENI